MELLRISIENVLFHLSELFTYLNKVILLLGQRGSDNRGRTVLRDPLVCAIGGSVVVFGKNRVLKLCVVANY